MKPVRRWIALELMNLRAILSCVSVAVLLLSPGSVSAQIQTTDSDSGVYKVEPVPEPVPGFSLHGFSDVNYSWRQMKPSSNNTTTEDGFSLGMFELYFVSNLGSRVSFLGESVFEMNDENEWGVDVERVVFKYSWSDLFRIAGGRTHTAFGYWNEAYHHGALLQPTIERPEALKFEDDGGILPVHSVGIEVSGHVSNGNWGLGYVGNLANGRASHREVVQGASDANRSKAIALKLSANYVGVARIQFGPMIYHDVIPADHLTPGREGEIRENIVGAHFHLQSSHVELMTEYFRLYHRDLMSGNHYGHSAWYGILAWTLGRWRPYAGVDLIDFETGDPYYTPDDNDLTRLLAGVRLDINTSAALKLEYNHDRQVSMPSNMLRVQAAFSF